MSLTTSLTEVDKKYSQVKLGCVGDVSREPTGKDFFFFFLKVAFFPVLYFCFFALLI